MGDRRKGMLRSTFEAHSSSYVSISICGAIMIDAKLCPKQNDFRNLIECPL